VGDAGIGVAGGRGAEGRACHGDVSPGDHIAGSGVEHLSRRGRVQGDIAGGAAHVAEHAHGDCADALVATGHDDRCRTSTDAGSRNGEEQRVDGRVGGHGGVGADCEIQHRRNDDAEVESRRDGRANDGSGVNVGFSAGEDGSDQRGHRDGDEEKLFHDRSFRWKEGLGGSVYGIECNHLCVLFQVVSSVSYKKQLGF
jgi:hypothetical protein